MGKLIKIICINIINHYFYNLILYNFIASLFLSTYFIKILEQHTYKQIN